MLGLHFLMQDLMSTPYDWTKDVEPVPYTPKFRFAKEMFFTGESYTPFSLMDVEPCASVSDGSGAVFSPNGLFMYREVVLKARASLDCSSGKKRGSVAFDSDVLIPQVHQVFHRGEGRLKTDLWMSHTPNEVMTLRPGTRLAKGHVVIGGLGLGYQLLEVAKKKSVKRITVIERGQELVDWLLPLILAKLPREIQVDVVVGDVFEELPKLTADVALVDVWASMSGCQGYSPKSARGLRKSTPNIPTIWCWGESS